MKRSLFAISVALMLFAVPLIAGQGGPKPKPPSAKPHVSTPKPAAKPQASTTKIKPISSKPTVAKGKPLNAPKPVKTTKITTQPVKTTKATGAQKATTKAAKADTKVAKADAKTARVEAKAEAKTAKADSKKSTSTSTSTSESTSTSPNGTDTGDVTLTAIQQKLQRNTKLADKLEARLPKGTDLMLAAEGFKNLGQFVAAVNVSHNLGLDFVELKADMLSGKSLGQSIQEQRKVSSATVEAQRAEYDARVLIAETEQVPTTTTTSATTATTPATSSTTTSTKKPKHKAKKTLTTTQPSTLQQ